MRKEIEKPPAAPPDLLRPSEGDLRSQEKINEINKKLGENEKKREKVERDAAQLREQVKELPISQWPADLKAALDEKEAALKEFEKEEKRLKEELAKEEKPLPEEWIKPEFSQQIKRRKEEIEKQQETLLSEKKRLEEKIKRAHPLSVVVKESRERIAEIDKEIATNQATIDVLTSRARKIKEVSERGTLEKEVKDLSQKLQAPEFRKKTIPKAKQAERKDILEKLSDDWGKLKEAWVAQGLSEEEINKRGVEILPPQKILDENLFTMLESMIKDRQTELKMKKTEQDVLKKRGPEEFRRRAEEYRTIISKMETTLKELEDKVKITKRLSKKAP